MDEKAALLRAMEEEKARILEEAAAKAAAIDQDIADIDRLRGIAGRYGFSLLPKGASANNGAAPSNSVPGTIAALIETYRTNPLSPYYRKRFGTRGNTDHLCKTLAADLGHWRISDLKLADVQATYEKWVEKAAAAPRGGNGQAMAQALLTQLRTLVNYGARELQDDSCVHLSFALRTLRNKVVTSTVREPLTEQNVKDIIAKAHEMSLRSIALAQAFQFDANLTQIDVLGDWIPQDEPEASDIIGSGKIGSGKKWVRGLRWEEIDENLILRHRPSNGKGDELVIDLKRCPNVMKEFFDQKSARRTPGPIIVFEQTGQPYFAPAFRILWRKVARAAGVPDHVKNMDSRDTPGAKGARANGQYGEFAIPRGTLVP
jgi:hypothetical protein